MAEKKEVDQLSGIETTGHEWDGIRELNNPLPRWWVWTFYATIIWSIGYWIVMPAWPLVTGYTAGVLGYSQRAVVAEQLAERQAAQQVYADRIDGASLDEIRSDPELLAFALAGGRSAFAVNCSQCHGAGAAGSPGYPNLNDDDWMWGGTLDAIQQTINFGIRSDHDETRVNDMPAFLVDELLTREEIADVAEYVLSLSGQAEDQEAVARGQEIYAEQCAACHLDDGRGDQELGAPNLTDAIWLHGGDRATVIETIAYSRRGVMPPWVDRLSPAAIKQLAVYVHTLGGGE